MTHYGPSARRTQHPTPKRPELDALIEKSRPPKQPTTIGLAGDGTSIKLSLAGMDSFGSVAKIEKELDYDEAVELARRLLNEAAVLLKRGVQR
jgi:hypothetical protein